MSGDESGVKRSARPQKAGRASVRGGPPDVTLVDWLNVPALVLDPEGSVIYRNRAPSRPTTRASRTTAGPTPWTDSLHAVAICGTTTQAREQLARRQAEGSLARDLTYLAPLSFLTSERRRAAYALGSLGLLDAVADDKRSGDTTIAKST